MSGSHVLLSSDFPDYQTPSWFLDLVRAVGPIALDPFTASNNPTGARRFFAPDDGKGTPENGWMGPCGLAGTWPTDGLAFVNPRYGRHLSGPIDPEGEVKKKGIVVARGTGMAEKIAQHAGEKISLVPVRTETVWWRRLFATSHLVLLWASDEHGARISFFDPRTGKYAQGSNLASTVFYTGPNARAFAQAFAPHGTLIRGGLR